MVNYSLEMEKGIAGSIADSKHVDADSKCIETASAAELAFGSPVKAGTKDSLVQHLSADADKIHGLLKHKHNEQGLINDLEAYSIVRKGRMFVVADEAVDVGEVAYYNRATKKFGKTAGVGFNEVKGSEFKTSALAADELVVLEINLPQ